MDLPPVSSSFRIPPTLIGSVSPIYVVPIRSFFAPFSFRLSPLFLNLPLVFLLYFSILQSLVSYLWCSLFWDLSSPSYFTPYRQLHWSKVGHPRLLHCLYSPCILVPQCIPHEEAIQFIPSPMGHVIPCTPLPVGEKGINVGQPLLLTPLQ